MTPPAPPGPWRRAAKSWLPAVLVAVVLRATLIQFVPPEGLPYGDLNVYHQVALGMSESSDAWMLPGGEFGYRAPLYFAYLAAFHWLTDFDTYHGSQMANLALVVILLILLYFVARDAFGPAVATLAIWLRALLPAFVLSDLVVMTELLFDVCLLGMLFLLLRGHGAGLRKRDVIGLGLLMGAAILTREVAKGLAAICFVVVILQQRGAWRRIYSGVLFAAAIGVVCLPWMWRNAEVWGSPLPLSLTTGVNLHMGNHPHSTGVYSEFSDPDHILPPHIVFGTREYDAWHKQHAIQYVREAPGRTLAMSFWKVAYLVWPQWHRHILMSGMLFPDLPRVGAIALVALSGVGTVVLWLLGSLGVAARLRDRFTWAVLILFGYTCATVMVAYGSPRYAEPVQMLFLIPLSWTVLHPRRTWEQLRQEPHRLLVAAAAASGFVLLWGSVAVRKILAA